MQEAVEGCRRHDGITGEDLAPVAEGLVAGDDDWLTLVVALSDDLEEQAGLNRVERQVADFVDDQQSRTRLFISRASLPSAIAFAMRRAMSMALVK